MKMKFECRLDAMARLQQLTNDDKANPADYLITEEQREQMGQIHDLEYRVKNIEGFELPHAIDDYERLLIRIPRLQETLR